LTISTFFANPSAWGVGLALIFGAFWLFLLRPVNLRSPWPWVVFIAGATLFAPCIVWIQVPLQNRVGTALIGSVGIIEYQKQLLWTGIPVVLLSGLVQEGAKLVPVAVFWLFNKRTISPKLGLCVGAMAGAGFGIFEAQWVLNSIFASGWNWSIVQAHGFLGIAGFWERFFTIAFHTASAALIGWGLAKGYGWQFYLLTSSLHFLVNYPVLLLQKGYLTSIQIEIVVAVLASIIYAVVLWLRWRRSHLKTV
jgi:RsiW-degrading membrane proteinase PrsW (M82 family)